jgi:tRNA pseudouridine(38-40) synthase
LVFDVIADAFLYHMVRHMVALQTAVGHGKVDPHSLVDYLDPPSGSQVYVQGMAPAQGLCLVNVKYPPEKIRLE